METTKASCCVLNLGSYASPRGVLPINFPDDIVFSFQLPSVNVVQKKNVYIGGNVGTRDIFSFRVL